MSLVQTALHTLVQDHMVDGLIPCYSSEAAALASEGCNDSVHFFYPHRVQEAASQFVNGFRGASLYAVKANPHAAVLLEAWRAGIRAFDVASIREVELVHRLLPEAELYFMHPVKSRQAIRKAYSLGVRSFAFDSGEELNKILTETDCAADISLFLRVAVPVKGALYDLTGKFGASVDETPELLQAASAVSSRVGMSFHVGSQCMDPEAFCGAIAHVAGISKIAGVSLDVIDVGGGFPVSYPGLQAPPLKEFFDAIHSALDLNGFGQIELLCEPGRALVAEAGATAVRIELRKNDMLYLNDGTYGALFDAGVPAWPFNIRLLRLDGQPISPLQSGFSAYGPTCDSIDKMDGPFALPVDCKEGDWIVFENLGSYGQTMQSRFNGFYSDTLVAIMDNLPV